MRRAAFAFLLTVLLPICSTRAASGTLPEIKLDSVSLTDALDFIRDVSGANLHVDWKALETAGVGKDTPVSAHLRNVSVAKVLTILLNEAAPGDVLTYYVDGGVIEITTRDIADKQMVTRIYPVGDLLVDVPDFEGPDMDISQNSSAGRGNTSGQNIFSSGQSNNEAAPTRTEKAQQLIDLITSVIRPEIWTVNGGTASIRFFNGVLIVTAPRSVQDAIDDQ